mmetsp:Transcript_22797/g.73322  ORF Transcript_22797/g.73322 Transcript_22797/m.73322 type:complete len:158 (-) Transcript_22797:157-630(-)
MANEKAETDFVSSFVAMGFAKEDAERAWSAAKHDKERAVNLLLNQNTGAFFSPSPHDVLLETPEPYKPPATQQRQRQRNATKKDPEKDTNFTRDLPKEMQTGSLKDVPPGVVVDARLTQFVAMGFDLEASEDALDRHRGDVNAALSSLLSSREESSS